MPRLLSAARVTGLPPHTFPLSFGVVRPESLRIDIAGTGLVGAIGAAFAVTGGPGRAATEAWGLPGKRCGGGRGALVAERADGPGVDG